MGKFVFNPFTGKLDYTENGGVGIQSVVAGSNITIDDTDPQNPIISASGGGGDPAIGNPVIGATPYRMLSTDSSGNLTDNVLAAEVRNLFGFVDYSYLSSPFTPNSGDIFIDATPLGGSETRAFAMTSGVPYNLSMLDIDTFNTYLTVGKDNAGNGQFIFAPNGQSVDSNGAIVVNASGLRMSDTGATIFNFSDDETFADNANNRVQTSRATKVYVDNQIAAIGSGTPGGLNKEIQFNNAGVFGGASAVYHDPTLTFPNIGIGASSPNSPLTITADPGNTTDPSINVTLSSSYVGGSQQAAARFKITGNAAGSSSGYSGLINIANTATGTSVNTNQLYGFQGEANSRQTTGTTSAQYGAGLRSSNEGGGTISANYALRAFSALNSGGGTIDANYGVYIDDQTVGTDNYALYTGRGKVRLGGQTSRPYNVAMRYTNNIDATSGLAYGLFSEHYLRASANNDVLAANYFTGQFDSNSKTGLSKYIAHFQGAGSDTIPLRVTGSSGQVAEYLKITTNGNADVFSVQGTGRFFQSMSASDADGAGQKQSIRSTYTGAGAAWGRNLFFIGANSATTSYWGDYINAVTDGAGAVTLDQIGGVDIETVYQPGTGTANKIFGIRARVKNGSVSTATATDAYAVYIRSAVTNTANNISNVYGLFIEDQTTGGTLNRAIKTGLGLVEFGDAVFMKNITAPSGTPSGGGYLYVESGALKYKGSSGTVTTLGVA